jgi:dipeptidyl aminopeptidase/acylaminoacyl peptidase
MIKLSLLSLVLAATPAATLAAGRAITSDDFARIATVRDPQVDPAGAWVAYSVSTVDAAADKSVSHIWMTSWDGARTLQLTNRSGESESNPRFSPDGRWLAFVSGRAQTGAQADDRLWLMDRAGGEGRPLSGIKGSVTDFAWSPDSKWIALVVEDPDPEAAQTTTVTITKPGDAPAAARPGQPEPAPSSAPTVTAKEKPPQPIVIDRFHFKQDREGYLGKKRSRLWLYHVASGQVARVTTGDYDEALPAWSPDSSRIAFASNRSLDPDRNYASNLFVAMAGGPPTEPTQLTRFEGPNNAPQWGSPPAWSPDGREIAYLEGAPAKLIGYGVRKLAVVQADSGAGGRVLTAALDRNVSHPIWTPDGKSIRVIEEDDEAAVVAEVPAAGGPLHVVAGGWRVFSAPAPAAGGGLAVLLSTPSAPPEVFALDPSGALRQLSHQNDAWLKEVALAPTVRTRFKSRDGTEVHGLLVTPPGAALGRKLPTMLYSHGGPNSQSGADFSIQWQITAARGYAVVASNYRGSTGRGQAFSAALYAKWGSVDVQDALAAVDDAVARGVADPDKLVVGGWSYGGMLTNYLIASDKRFKAAVSGASISNILAGYGTDQYALDYEIELGTPWANPQGWMKISYPFFQNPRIVTPTLFMVGDKDFNVPLQNSEQMYQALKSRGVDTQLVIYPGQFHGLTRPSFLKDRQDRWLAWYDSRLAAAAKP